MSDTPRSDEVWSAPEGTDGDIASSMYSLAQDLERELSAARAMLLKAHEIAGRARIKGGAYDAVKFIHTETRHFLKQAETT